jgi:carbon monoxide dehydrogenase subunit G
MKFTGELTVDAPREAVFDRLQDARFFASCVEGVQDLNALSPTQYTAIFETKIAYMRFKFDVAVEMTKAERPHSIEAKIEGKPLGIIGRLAAIASAEFAEAGAQTLIRYAIEASLAGKLGSIGQPVLKSKAKDMETKFVANLRKAFDADAREGSP